MQNQKSTTALTRKKIKEQFHASLAEVLKNLHIQTESKKVKKLVQKTSKKLTERVFKELKRQAKEEKKALAKSGKKKEK